MAQEHRDFFISRAGAPDEWGTSDAEIAKAIDAILRDAGYTTWLQDNDFGHASFMARMAQGFAMVENGARILALVSRRYQASDACLKEARYPLIDDQNNKRERLIVLRVEDCAIGGFLKDLVYVDLVPVLHDREQLRAAVLGAVAPERFPAEARVTQFHQRAVRQILHPEIRAVAGFSGRQEEFAGLERALWGAGNAVAAITN
ncbi:MAG: toll/interleukin-1 receptor domain-containing protein, partial [Pseudomonadota bacterium]